MTTDIEIKRSTIVGEFVVLHSITDDEMAEYQALKSIAQKILQAQDNGTFGLIRERDRILTQLRDISRKDTP